MMISLNVRKNGILVSENTQPQHMDDNKTSCLTDLHDIFSFSKRLILLSLLMPLQ
jgi:hypothetical protein